MSTMPDGHFAEEHVDLGSAKERTQGWIDGKLEVYTSTEETTILPIPPQTVPHIPYSAPDPALPPASTVTISYTPPLMHDRLEEIFRLQSEFNARIGVQSEAIALMPSAQ